MKAVWEEVEKDPEPTEQPLPTTLAFDEIYEGYIDYTYVLDSTNKNVTSNEVMIGVPKTSLAADGTIKVTFKISGIADVASALTVQGVFDKWGWADSIYAVPDDTSVMKKWTITQEGLDSIEGENALFKIVVQNTSENYNKFDGTKFRLSVKEL